jgi:hypothetical protein
MNNRPPKTLGILYLRFTADHDPQKAEEIFMERYGTKPEFAWLDQNQLWMGPCPEGDESRPLESIGD